MARFLDRDHPMFRRAWVRWATVVVPTVWGLFELFAFASPGWAILFLAAGAYALYELILRQ